MAQDSFAGLVISKSFAHVISAKLRLTFLVGQDADASELRALKYHHPDGVLMIGNIRCHHVGSSLATDNLFISFFICYNY